MAPRGETGAFPHNETDAMTATAATRTLDRSRVRLPARLLLCAALAALPASGPPGAAETPAPAPADPAPAPDPMAEPVPDGPTTAAAPAAPILDTPTVGCPCAPVIARLPAEGEAGHLLALPPGEWLIRCASADFNPSVSLTLPDGPDAPREVESLFGMFANAVRVSVPKGATVRFNLSAKAENAGGLYCVSAHPVRPRPRWREVSRQTLELGPTLTFPTPAGPRCAAPVVAMLKAGQRYRVGLWCDNADVYLHQPAQHGLRPGGGSKDGLGPGDDIHGSLREMLEQEFKDGMPDRASDLSFIAPRDGLYLFWCLADDADFRTRVRCRIETSDPRQEGLFPGTIARSGPRNSKTDGNAVVLWHRPDLWLVPKDPDVFVPVPARTPAVLRFRSGATRAEFVIRSAGGVEFPLTVEPKSDHAYTVSLIEGEPGIWLRSKGSTGEVDFDVTIPAPPHGAAHGGDDRVHLLELPAVLRGRVRAGQRVSVTTWGAGCGPQIAVRGAGITAQCMDPTGYSIIATTEGLATRDGEVEVLVTAAAAEPGAVAMIRVEGMDSGPVGAGARLDLAEIQWLSTPGEVVLAESGAWTDEDERLPSGTRVDWYRAPMKAGHVYRILAGATDTPDLILDIPGSGKSSAAGGTAIVKPAADGDATLGLAAPGADATGAYALQVCDLGPEVPGKPDAKPETAPAPEAKP